MRDAQGGVREWIHFIRGTHLMMMMMIIIKIIMYTFIQNNETLIYAQRALSSVVKGVDPAILPNGSLGTEGYV